MYKIPRYWRRFKQMMTLQDILTGRKITKVYWENNRQLMKVEVVK